MDENANLVVYEIDDVLRTITIPGNGSILGVCGDAEINRVRFKMPRYCAGFDLSEFTARVNYVNPNGDANYYEADEVAASYDSASFVWLMKSDVTNYVGDVEFSVRLYKKQNERIVKSFNTRAVTGRILEGLDVEKQVTPEQQQTLLGKLEAEVKESIDNYVQTINEDFAKLKEDFDNTVGVVGTFSKVVEDVTSGTTFYIKSKLELNDITCHIIKDTIVSGKEVAINVRYSDNTNTVYPFIDGKTISVLGKTITSIEVYVDANYMPQPYSIAGYLTSSDLSGFLVKDAKNIKALEEKTQTLQTDVGFAEKISGTALAGQGTNIVFLKNLFKSTVSVFVLKNTIEKGKEWAVMIKCSDGTIKNCSLKNSDFFYVKSIGNYNLFEYKIDGLKIVDFKLYLGSGYITQDATISVIVGSGNSFKCAINSYIIELLESLLEKKHIDEISSKYRYIIFGFTNKDMQLCISGSNDACENIDAVGMNIYKPSLGNGTVRDPSYMFYKGYWYFVYTSIDWTSGNADIGFCRTRDMIHFYELPHLSCNNRDYPNIPRVYAPAFCVIDNHIYIISQGLGDGGPYTGAGITYDETNYTKCYVTMVHEYNPQNHTLTYIGKIDGFSDIDTHIYKQGDYYYAAVKNFKLYKANSLLGKYELLWDGAEKSSDGTDVYREGAFMIQLPDDRWRFFAQKPGIAYDYCDSISKTLDDGFGEIQSCSVNDLSSMHFTIRDMLNDYNVIN